MAGTSSVEFHLREALDSEHCQGQCTSKESCSIYFLVLMMNLDLVYVVEGGVMHGYERLSAIGSQ